MANVPNGNMQTQIAKSIKDVGIPTFFAIAFGWVMLQYWIAPQTDLIKAMTVSNTKLGETFEALTEGMEANQTQLSKIATSTEQTNASMVEAKELMADVPAQRNEELTLLKQMCEASYPDIEFRKKIFDDHGKMLKKLGVVDEDGE